MKLSDTTDQLLQFGIEDGSCANGLSPEEGLQRLQVAAKLPDPWTAYVLGFIQGRDLRRTAVLNERIERGDCSCKLCANQR